MLLRADKYNVTLNLIKSYWCINPAIINRKAIESPKIQNALNDLAKGSINKIG